MNPLPFSELFAVAGSADSLRTIEFDWPSTTVGWSVSLGALLLLVCLAVGLYRRDTRDLNRGWRVLLPALRLLLIAVLIVIAVNPQERVRQMSFRPSRVAVLVDTSLSMRFPQSSAAREDGSKVSSSQQPTRADAAQSLLANSPLLSELRKQHNVRIYTFDAGLSGPYAAFPTATETGNAVPNSSGTDQLASTQGATGAKKNGAAIEWEEIVRPRGLETRLGEAVIEGVRQLGGRTLSGLVIVSDGNSNAGVEPSTAQEIAKAANARLITVGVGSTEQPVNLQVASIQAPSDVHVRDPYEFSAFIQAYGLSRKSVTVELLARPDGDEKAAPKVIETREVTLREEGVPIEVRFRQTPTVAGAVEYVVRVRPPTGVHELSVDDNERRKTVNVIDRKLRVLVMASGPMREYRFLHTMLARHQNLEVDVWLQTVQATTVGQVSQEAHRILVEFPKTAAELFEYDVVIAFDVDWGRIPDERRSFLLSWVSDHAGGLILAAGDIYTPQLASASDELGKVKDLYPVFLSASISDLGLDARSEQPWPILLTREGREAGFLQLAENASDAAAAWKRFPGVYRCYPTGGAKAGATVYANFGDPRAQNDRGQPPILLAAQFYGSGRTLYLGSPELWRLRAVEEDYFDRFWTKAIREVGQGRLRRGAARGLLLLERNQYALGQTIRIRANLLDPQLHPLEIETVECDVLDPRRIPLVNPHVLNRDGQRKGQYWTDFRASIPGTYRVTIRPQPGDEKQNLVAKIDVVVPNLESDNPRQNAKLLTDLARETGGRYLPVEKAAAEIPSLLPDRSERIPIDEQLRTLWDQEWVLYALVGLLGCEWLIRKLLRLA
jgi:hypothetical protein